MVELIYLPYGELSISNCKFINNSAHWFGGAIASENECGISITGTTFENCRSVDDAGGAIYAFSLIWKLRAQYFNNCSANFAGAICSLNSEMLIFILILQIILPDMKVELYIRCMVLNCY